MIHVIHHPVVTTHNAKKVFVPACLNFKEIHTLLVDRNVYSPQSAQKPRHASGINVWTHAQELAGRMHSVL